MFQNLYGVHVFILSINLMLGGFSSDFNNLHRPLSILMKKKTRV